MRNLPRLRLLWFFIAAFALSAPAARGTVYLQFNNSGNNVVGGSPQTIQVAPGGSVVLSLQLVSTTETTLALETWLWQFAGPSARVFSITGRDLTGSRFGRPEWGNDVVLSSADQFSNSSFGGKNNPDGVADNVLGPRNGPTLGGRFSNGHNPPGTHQVATFTLTLSPAASFGLYEIRTFSYPGVGWTDPSFNDNPFDNHAAIRIEVVPEGGTSVLLALGIVVLGVWRKFRSG